jgi:hypothetical protein
MNWGIDGNAYALRQYERQQDYLQRMDDWLEETMSEIYDTPEWLERVIADSSDELDLEEAVENAAREYIREQQEMKHECCED